MLNIETKRHIDSARQVLVGKVPDPKSQIEQITNALIYKFMDDMDARAIAHGGQATFFTDNLAEYSWSKLMDRSLGAQDRMNRYDEALRKFGTAKQLPSLFRTIFKEALLPFKSPETLNLFLNEITYFNYKNSEELGNAFEYLLSTLGTQGDAGQFRTPRHIIDFIVDVIDPKKTDTILDPACGTAGFLISAFKHIAEAHDGIGKDGKPNDEKRLTPVERKKIMENITGYDISPDMVRLSLVNMYLHGSQYGLQNPNIIEYDTLSQTDRWDEKFDVILANPPFMTPKGGVMPHGKFEISANRAEVLFVDYIKTHLKPNGRAGIIVPEGVIFQSSNAYIELRKLLVEDGLYAVVSLPSGVFNPYSGVKTSVLFFDNTISKQTKKVLFIKIDSDGYGLGAQRKESINNDLPKATKLLKDYKNNSDKNIKDSSFSWVVNKSKILESNDCSLMGEKYKTSTRNTNEKCNMVELSTISEIKKGTSITKKDVTQGDIPVIAGGQKPAYYHNTPNRIGKTITVSASGAYAGFVNYFDTPIFASDCTTIQSKNEEVLMSDFLFYLLKGKQDDIYKFQQGGAQPHVYSKDLAKIKIPLLPIESQKEIIDEINSKQLIIDEAKDLIQKIEKERKNSSYLFERLVCDFFELEKISEINPKKSETKNLKDINVSFVPMSDLSDDGYVFIPKEERKIESVQTSYTYFKNGDVLLAKVTPCFENGKIGIAANLINGIGFGSSEFVVIRPSDKILAQYLYYFLIQDKFKNEAKVRMTGTGGLKRIPTDYISKITIPVPDIEIQKQIVEKFEKQQNLLNSSWSVINLFEQEIKDVINRLLES